MCHQHHHYKNKQAIEKKRSLKLNIYLDCHSRKRFVIMKISLKEKYQRLFSVKLMEFFQLNEVITETEFPYAKTKLAKGDFWLKTMISP